MYIHIYIYRKFMACHKFKKNDLKSFLQFSKTRINLLRGK